MEDGEAVSEQTDAQQCERELRELSFRWSAAADRAFASALSDPATYARTLRLVKATVVELSTRGPGEKELLDAWAGRSELIAAVAGTDDRLTTAGLDLESVAGAAFTMRYREVREELVRTRRRDAIAALGEDSGWAVLEESGPYLGDLFVPYHRLEVEARTGRAILVTARANDDFSAPVHIVELMQFDRGSGQLIPFPEDAPPREFVDVDEREEHVAGQRSVVET